MTNTASTWQYVVVTGPLRVLRDAFWKFCHVKSALSTVVSPIRDGNEDTLVLRNSYVALRDNTAQKFLISYICLTLLIRGGFTQRCDHGIIRAGVTAA